jgi:hypothetical protein
MRPSCAAADGREGGSQASSTAAAQTSSTERGAAFTGQGQGQAGLDRTIVRLAQPPPAPGSRGQARPSRRLTRHVRLAWLALVAVAWGTLVAGPQRAEGLAAPGVSTWCAYQSALTGTTPNGWEIGGVLTGCTVGPPPPPSPPPLPRPHPPSQQIRLRLPLLGPPSPPRPRLRTWGTPHDRALFLVI